MTGRSGGAPPTVKIAMSLKQPASQRAPAAQARAARQSARRQEALALLGSLDCLRSVPQSELARLLELCVFRSFQTGATVLGRITIGKGSVRCSVNARRYGFLASVTWRGTRTRTDHDGSIRNSSA